MIFQNLEITVGDKKRAQKVRSLYVCGAALLVSLLVAPAWGYEKEIDALSSTMAEKIAGKGKKTVAVVDLTDLEGNLTSSTNVLRKSFPLPWQAQAKASG